MRRGMLLACVVLLAACGGGGEAPPAEAAADDPPAAERPMPAAPMGGETSGTAEPNDSLPASPPSPSGTAPAP